MEYGEPNGIYREQQPLRPPPMMPPPSVHASVSPRFESIMTRSNFVPWSPAHSDRTPDERPTVDPLSTSYSYVKSSDVWPNNSNPNQKPVEGWMLSSSIIKPSDEWTNNNPTMKPSDGWMNNNIYTKSSEIWTNNNNVPAKPWSPNNTLTKVDDSTLVSNNSSNVPMIKSSDKTCSCLDDACSPRCKLGILGFIIGFLAVGIALAVVLVLWLRQ